MFYRRIAHGPESCGEPRSFWLAARLPRIMAPVVPGGIPPCPQDPVGGRDDNPPAGPDRRRSCPPASLGQDGGYSDEEIAVPRETWPPSWAGLGLSLPGLDRKTCRETKHMYCSTPAKMGGFREGNPSVQPSHTPIRPHQHGGELAADPKPPASRL